MPPTVIIVALFAVIVWGASPVGTKVAVAELPPIAVAALRTALGGVASLPLALALRIPWPKGREQRRLLLLSSFCGFIAFPILFSFGVRHTSALHASMILALLPVVTGGIAMAWDRQWPHRRWWIGCAIATIGAVVLALSRGSASAAPSSLLGDGLILLTNVAGAAGYVSGGRLKQSGYPSQGATFWGVVLANVMVVPSLPWVLDGIDWPSVSFAAWAGVLYLAIGVTIIGYVSWYWALGKGGIARVGLFQFLQPISGVILAWLLLSEPVSDAFLLATALVLSGVWIATRAR
ncbi:MAG: DMT family transporter [Alphaproteobacteria bacterium]